jgi:hypothetical protein|tara:strand:+ start:669 stop:863 length:195 start_codon:yes stop_codon:yes gene_type:complete
LKKKLKGNKIKTKKDSKTIGSLQPTLLAYKGQALRVLKKISTSFFSLLQNKNSSLSWSYFSQKP